MTTLQDLLLIKLEEDLEAQLRTVTQYFQSLDEVALNRPSATGG